jgi:hypothetical protein
MESALFDVILRDAHPIALLLRSYPERFLLTCRILRPTYRFGYGLYADH